MIRMKITKEILKKLVREALEDEMGSSESGKSDLVAKLKERLESMDGSDESGYGGWGDTNSDKWSYDDAEGGYYNELEVDFSNPSSIKVYGSNNGEVSDEETFSLNSEEDIDKIIKHAKEVSGLREDTDDEDTDTLKGYEGHEGEGDEPEYVGTYKQYADLKRKQKEEESGLAESVKRRFKLLANIKKKTLNEAEEMAMGESLGKLFSSFKETVIQLNDSVADDDYNGAVQGMKKAKEILQKMSDKIGELDIEHYGPAGEELQELVDMFEQ